MNLYFLNRKYLLVFLCIISIYYQANASETPFQNSAWMHYIEELADGEENQTLIENLFEELSYLSENPFNWNSVSKEELDKLPFLSEIQVENLLYYAYKYAPVQSIYELKNVDGMDMQTITYLLPFLYIGDIPKTKDNINPKKLLKYGKSELLIRSDYCFQEKSGFQTPIQEIYDKNPNKYYLGENYYLSVKYGFSYKDKIQIGFAGEKDSGEAFWNKQHKGFYYNSFHIILKNWGILKGLYIGDYKASFGQGLILNTDFAMGKTSSVISINKKNAGIRRHFSSNETDYLRGAAITLAKENCSLSIIYSHKSADAIANDIEITSFKTDGYNRTIKDLEKKDQATLNLAGGSFQWRTATFNAGASTVFYDFGGKTLSPTPQNYNLFYLRGRNNWNVAINYGTQHRLYSFQGETAIGKNRALATLNTLQFTPASFIAFVLSYRNYAKDFQSHYGNAFGENSTVQNESGIYFGSNIKLKKHWEINTYIDAFRFPWLKYGVNMPSQGSDFLLQLDYRPKSNWNMNLRYKQKIREKNDNTDNTTLVSVLPYKQTKIRYQSNYQRGTTLKLKFNFDYLLHTNTQNKKSKGYMISQQAGIPLLKERLQLDASFAYFNTENWDTRIYAYEKNVLYAFSFPTFYGEGWWAYLVCKFNIVKNITAYAKFSWTHYFDRNQIGSDLELIEGRDKADGCILVKVKW